MSFHPRKLLNDSSLEDSITKICESYCNIINNPDGSCPIACIPRCYHICNHPFYDSFPPPPPIYSDDDHPVSRSYKLSIFLTISLVLLATVFLGFLSYTVYKFYKGWYRSRIRQQPPRNPPQEAAEEARVDFLLDEDHGPVVDHPIWYIRTIGLEASIIKAITICKYKKADGIVEGTECSVCLNEFQEDESLRLLPKCNHAFHIPCIDTWLRSHTNCPLCRAGIVIGTADLGHLEESQLQVSENNTESGLDRELDEVESVQDGSGSRDRNELKRDEEEDGGLNGFQPLRRSVSVDSLSASMISNAINNEFSVPGRNLEKQDLEIGLKSSNSSAGSSTISSTSNGRSLQKGSSSSSSSSSMVMRSLSCSAKVFLSRYSRSSKSSVTLPRTF